MVKSLTSKKLVKVAVVGGNNLRVDDKTVSTIQMSLDGLNADEVIVTGAGGASLAGEIAASNLGVPNVLVSGAKLLERASVLIALPGGATTRNYVKMFKDANKKVVEIEAGK